MQSLKDAAVVAAIKQAVKYARKDPDKNLIKLLNVFEMFDRNGNHKITCDKLRKCFKDPENNWTRYMKRILSEIEPSQFAKLIPALLSSVVRSVDLRKKHIKEYDCNIPWAILMDPTAACNLSCTGCWAAKYEKKPSLSHEVMSKIIKEGKELGTYTYLFSGGEPLVKKKDIIRLCEENPDCVFLAFSNGTLVDEAFAKEIKRVGNFMLALSIEGGEEATDMRRGEGTYKKVLKTMSLLKKIGAPFGSSVCYHSKNIEEVCGKSYIDFMIKNGCLFTWYFTYMPVGKDAVLELMVNSEQRKRAHSLIRKAREEQPSFIIDFWNDGEYTGGCIAGGRHYLHINANGDVEPCAFVHYSNVNIKDVSLLEALKSPLFTEYYRNQPWNKNHLRPCPVLDNPNCIRSAVRRSGAHSTELLFPENVDNLAAKVDDIAKKWSKTAEKMWEDTPLEIRNKKPPIYGDKSYIKHTN